MMRLFLFVFILLYSWPGLYSQGVPRYIEKDSLIVIEAESIPANGWNFDFGKKGYSGKGYLSWEGTQFQQNPGNGLLEYSIEITNPGTYRFCWRTKIGYGDNTTEHNDSWLRFPDAQDYYGKLSYAEDTVRPKGRCTDDCPHDAPSSDGWFKVSSGDNFNWIWDTHTTANDFMYVYVRFDTAGVYALQLSARSSFHMIDRMVLYHNGYSNPTGAKSLELSETIHPDYEIKTFPLEFEILKSNGEAVPDFPVKLNKDTLFTNEDGRIQIAELNEGNYVYEFIDPGYTQLKNQFFHNKSLEIFHEITKVNAADILVTDSWEVPIQNVLVKIGDYSTSTSSDGSAHIGNLVDGVYDVFVYKGGYDVYRDEITLSRDTSLVFVLSSPNTGAIDQNQRISSLNLYPNPVSHNLSIDCKEDIRSVEIADICYRTLFSKNHIQQKEIQLDVSFLEPGIYFAIIRDYDNQVYLQRILKRD